MIVPTGDLLAGASYGGYAVAAFNIVDDLSLRAVIDAAEQERSPVIVQTSVKTVRAIGAPLLAAMFRARAEHSTAEVALHLDHCPDRAVISECIEAGWNSVLFDASTLGLAEATEQTRAVVAQAHARGVHVESEIENIRGVEDGIGSDDEGRRYPLDVVFDFVADTGIDSFAPAVGTAHGLYRDRPQLDPERVSDLVAGTGVPMVLHGGTGLSPADFTDLISRGCAKVNISTALKTAYMRAGLDHLVVCERTGEWNPPDLFAQIRAGVLAMAREHLVLFRGGATA